MARLILLLPLLLLLWACPRAPQTVTGPALNQLQPEHWPSLIDHGDKEEMTRALQRQIAWLRKQPDYQWQLGEVRVNQQQLMETLTRFEELWRELGPGPELERQLKSEFDLYQLEWDGKTDILITGYHAPVYQGSRTPDERYRYPLYGVPDDMVYLEPDSFNPKMLQKGPAPRGKNLPARLDGKRVVAYYTRQEIDEGGKLEGRGLELVYLDDYFKAFSFHVQGGGFVQLPDGSFQKLNYAGKNGLPYTSLGRLMVEDGLISKERISMQAIAEWFEQHPEDITRYCYRNESYVFYRTDGQSQPEIRPEMYPHGVLDFPVTPKRSIATDKRHFPGGFLAYLSGKQRGMKTDHQPFGAFVLDQDTGGAIKENHVDFFLGAGPEAEHNAGLLMDETGKVFILLKKPDGGNS